MCSSAHLPYTHLGPGVLFAEQICIEVCHLPLTFVCEAPHEFPIAHVMKLLPILLGFTAFFKPFDGLENQKKTLKDYTPHSKMSAPLLNILVKHALRPEAIHYCSCINHILQSVLTVCISMERGRQK